MSHPLHATCFDASALIKRYVDEPGSTNLRKYRSIQATRFTTPFCFYETLGILERLRLKGSLTKASYLRSATDLVSWFRASRREDIEFTPVDVFADAGELAESTDLDLSDAFQLLSLQAGYSAYEL